MHYMHGNVLTFDDISSATAKQNRHFLRADTSALQPPRYQLARLSAHTILVLPRKVCVVP